jgi:hypothetical protein
MNDRPKHMTEAEKDAWLKRQRELVPPTIPPSFVDTEICCYASDCLLSWLNERHPDMAASKLFNGILLANLYMIELAKNNGMVTREMDEDMSTRVIEVINCMGQLGNEW